MGEYFRFAGASTKTFGRFFRNEFDTIEKVARERVKTLQTQYIKLGRDANGAMQAIAVRPQVLDMQDLGTKTAIASQKAQLFNQLMKQGSTELLNFGKNTQWAGRQLMVGFTIPLGIMGAAAAKEFRAIEDQVIRLQRVYGDFTTTMADTQQITSQIKDLAGEFTKYGVAVSKTMGLAADAAAMGKTGADLVAQVSEANRLAVLGGVDQQQSLETTISLTNAFGVAADKLSGKINFLNAVENQTVTSIEDMTTAIPIAAPVIQQLGGNIEDLTFFLTAMKEGGINASEGANALKSGLASIINPTQEAKDMLNGFGISIESIVQQDKGNVQKMIVDIGTALNSLDPLNRAQAIETMFGKFQFARMSTLFKNITDQGSQAAKVLDLTKASASELATMSQRELAKVEASPLYKFQGAIENFKAALAPVGEEFMKAVTPLINFGTDILNKFNEMSDGGKQFVVILTGAVAGLGPVLLMTFGLIANGVANLIKGFMAVRSILSGTGRSSNILAEQTQYMTNEQLQAAAVATSLGQVHTSLIQTFNAEAGAVAGLTGAYQKAVAAQSSFMGPIVSGRGKSPRKMATGGMVPGSGNGDTVPAMLTPGEFVLRKDVVGRYPGLIAGMMSGNVRGFSDGGGVGNIKKVGMHAAGQMDMSLQANIDQANRLFPGMIATLEKFPELQNAIIFLTDLTVDKGQELNNAARAGGMGAEDFNRQWNETGNTGFIASAQRASTAMGTGDLSDAEIEELVGIDKEIGKRVTDRIRTVTAEQKLQPGWLDDIISEETGKIIDEGLQSTDSVKKSVAGKLDNRRSTMVETRSSGWSSLTDPRTGKPFKNSDDAIKYYEAAGALTQTSSGKQMTLAGSSTSIARKVSSGSWRSDSTAAAVGMIAGGHYATSGARSKRNSQEFKEFAEEQDRKWAGAASEAAQTASPSKRTKKVAKDTVDGFVMGLEEGKDDVARAGKDAGKEQAAAVKKNDNPAFGAVARGVTPPAVISPARMQHFQDVGPRIIGKVPNLQEAQMGAYGGTNILKGQELQFARGAKLLGLSQMLKPMNMLNAAITATTTAAKTAAINVKEFGVRTATTVKDFTIKTAIALKELAISAKQTAMNIGQSAKQMALSTAGKIKGFATSGKLGMMGMAASSGLMMASGTEGPLGDFARSVSGPMMAISGVASILSMIPGPAGLVVAGLAAVAGAFVLYNTTIDNARKSGEELANSMTMTKEKMDMLSSVTGKESISALAATERDAKLSGMRSNMSDSAKTAASEFKSQFSDSEIGKQFLDDIKKQMSSGRSISDIANNLSSQLSLAVADGIMTKDQADLAAEVLGKSIKSKKFEIELKGNLSEIVGPNGENLTNNPGAVANTITQRSAEVVGAQSKVAGEKTQSANINKTVAAGLGLGIMAAGGAMALTGVGAIPGLVVAAAGLATYMWESAIASGEIAKQAAISTELTNRAYLDNIKMTDVINSRYDGLIKEKQAQLELAQTDEQRKMIEGEITSLKQQQEKSLNNQKKSSQELIKNAEKNKNALGQGAWDEAQKKNIETTYKDDAAMQELAKKQYERASNESIIGNTTTQTTLEVQIASGALDPTTAETLIGALSGKYSGTQLTYNALITEQGDTAALNLVNSLTAAGATEATLSAQIDIAASDKTGETTQKLIQISQIATDLRAQGINMDINIESDRAKIEEIISGVSEIEAMFANGPVTGKVISQFIYKSTGFSLTSEQQAWFDSLPAGDQKVFATSYLTLVETIDMNSEAGRARMREYARNAEGKDYYKTGKYSKDTTINGKKYKTDYYAIAADMQAEAYASAQSSTVAAGAGAGGGSTGGQDVNSGGGGGSAANEPQLPTISEQYQASLSLISDQEDAINKKYDERLKALDAIQKAQEEITQQKKDQLSLADALTSGDMAAAARAMQETRANNAQRELERQKAALEEAKKKELEATTYNGHTRAWYEAELAAITAAENARVAAGQPKLATGGLILGPGSGISDSIPAMLSNGEYVVKASAVRAIGVNTLDLINAGKAKRFSTGRLVAPTYSVGGGTMNAKQLAGNKSSAQDTTVNQNSLYNYSINVNASTYADPNEIAKTVMRQIRSIDSRRVRGNYING